MRRSLARAGRFGSALAVIVMSASLAARVNAADRVVHLVLNEGVGESYSMPYGQSPLPWNDMPGYYQTPGCLTGVTDGPVFSEVRCAFQMPLTGLPPDAVVRKATLQLHVEGPMEARQTALYCYPGAVRGGLLFDGWPDPPLLFTPTTRDVTLDVTTLLTKKVVKAGWAGFALREQAGEASPGTTEATEWGRVALRSIDQPFPMTLTIDYSVASRSTPTFAAGFTPPPTSTAQPEPSGASSTVSRFLVAIGVLAVLLVAAPRRRLSS